MTIMRYNPQENVEKFNGVYSKMYLNWFIAYYAVKKLWRKICYLAVEVFNYDKLLQI